MEGLTAILVQAAAGVLGGGAAGNTSRAERLGLLPKLVAGAIGGIAAGALLGLLVATPLAGEVAPAADAAAAAAGPGWQATTAQIVGALVGGGVLTAVVAGLMRRA